MGLLRRIWFLFRRRSRERELQAEIEQHLDRVAEELTATGMTADAARAEARRRFGNPTHTWEESRSVWAFAWLDALLIDLRHTLRGLPRSPTFTIVAVLVLGLGIGANTAVFSVVDATVLHPLPLPHPEQLVAVTSRAFNDFAGWLSWPDYVDLRDQSNAYQGGLAAYRGGPYTLTGMGEPEVLRGTISTANLFAVLGVQPALGRAFADGEDEPGRNHVVVLTHRL